MKPMKWLSGIAVLALVATASGCGGGASNTMSTQPQSGSVFVSGTDAPLPSVVSFQVDITGLTVSDGVNPPVSVLSGTQTVDFARLNGLHTPTPYSPPLEAAVVPNVAEITRAIHELLDE